MNCLEVCCNGAYSQYRESKFIDKINTTYMLILNWFLLYVDYVFDFNFLKNDYIDEIMYTKREVSMYTEILKIIETGL